MNALIYFRLVHAEFVSGRHFEERNGMIPGKDRSLPPGNYMRFGGMQSIQIQFYKDMGMLIYLANII